MVRGLPPPPSGSRPWATSKEKWVFSEGRAGRKFSLATSIRLRLGVVKGEGDEESSMAAGWPNGLVEVRSFLKQSVT